MKKAITLTILSVFCLTYWTNAQDFSTKYGTVTDYEMNMTSYAEDPEASAVILYQKVDTWYEWVPTKRIICDYYFKVKVLTDEGVDKVKAQIRYLETKPRKDYLSGVRGTVYNLKNGKITKTKLSKKNISKDNISDLSPEDYKLINEKIARLRLWKQSYLKETDYNPISVTTIDFPNVKVGSVIEYKYRVTHLFAHNIPALNIQYNIPVKYFEADIQIPDVYNSHYEIKGHSQVNITTEDYNRIQDSPFYRGAVIGKRLTFTALNVPAFKEEPYVWHGDDYRTMVEFDTHYSRYPEYASEYFSDWKSINRVLTEENNFGSHAKMTGLLRSEASLVKQQTKDQQEQIRAILNLVRSKIKWNGYYQLTAFNPSGALKNGIGSSAEVNFILSSALRDAGFETIILMLSPRHYGRIPELYASFHSLTTIIVAVITSVNKVYYLDATDPYSDINVLPTPVMVEKARIYVPSDVDMISHLKNFFYGAKSKPTEAEAWVDLTNISDNRQKNSISVTISEDGIVDAKENRIYTNSEAMSLKKLYYSMSEEEYTKTLESESNIKIKDFKISNLDTSDVTQEISYSTSAKVIGGKIHFAPMLDFLIHDSVLIDNERIHPIEYNYLYNREATYDIEIPVGYKFDYLPSSINLSSIDNIATFSYKTIKISDSKITIKATVQLNKIVIPAQRYSSLKEFFDLVAEKCSSEIIVSKEE